MHGIGREYLYASASFPQGLLQVVIMAYVQAFLSLIFSPNHDIGGVKLSQ